MLSAIKHNWNPTNLNEVYLNTAQPFACFHPKLEAHRWKEKWISKTLTEMEEQEIVINHLILILT